jgi:hypothetical protein
VRTIFISGNTEDYASYRYLSLGTIVGVDHPAVSTGLSFSLGNSANSYARLDRPAYTNDVDSNRPGQTVSADTYFRDLLYFDAPAVRFHDDNAGGYFAKEYQKPKSAEVEFAEITNLHTMGQWWRVFTHNGPVIHDGHDLNGPKLNR